MPQKPLIFSLILIALLSFSRLSNAESLRILVVDKYEMPWAEINNNQLQGGMLFDLGNAIAQQLGRTAVYIPLPRKRIASVLEAGQADLVCNQNPVWLSGPFDWTKNFIPHVDVLISNQQQPRPYQLSDLANVRIGTTLGFRYLELEEALGEGFIRDDSLTARTNLLKLQAGHVHHIIIDRHVLQYQQQQYRLQSQIHPYLLISKRFAGCAVSRQGQIPIAALNKAIAQLEKKATLKGIFEHYR